MMLFIIISFSITVLCPGYQVTGAHQSIIYARGIFCKGNPEYIANQSCYIKAVRGKTGLINMYVNYTKPLKDIWTHGELFYRFGTIYRQWLVKFDFDACELGKGLSNNPFISLAVAALRNYNPNLIKPCPISGFVIKDQDMDSVWHDILPPTFPAGHYKLEWNLHTSENVIFNEVVFKFEIKGIGLADLTMLNMG